MSIKFWVGVTTAVRDCYHQSAVAQYGATLGCDCGDCPVGPDLLDIPAPRPPGHTADCGSVDPHPAQVS